MLYAFAIPAITADWQLSPATAGFMISVTLFALGPRDGLRQRPAVSSVSAPQRRGRPDTLRPRVTEIDRLSGQQPAAGPGADHERIAQPRGNRARHADRARTAGPTASPPPGRIPTASAFAADRTAGSSADRALRCTAPGVLGGGSNNVQLVAGHRVWLVSPAFAKALEGVVPDGSLTGGAVAKARRFVAHLEDILKSVTESRHHFGEVAGEYAQAIRDHLPEIAGIVAAFIIAEATSAFLAATPTGVGQIAAVVIQLGLTAFGAAGAIQAGAEAMKHAGQWLTLAWTAKGDDKQISAASKEFLKMLVGIAMATLSALGAKANYGNVLKIANSMPTGDLPAFAIAGGGRFGGAGAGTGVLVGPGTGSLGVAGNAMMQADDKKGGAGRTDRNRRIRPRNSRISSRGWRATSSAASKSRLFERERKSCKNSLARELVSRYRKTSPLLPSSRTEHPG